ncbi:MAG: hypothetical protein JWO85_1576 [Candidatus Eremiobacteraeota bacterium]|nr:hypothetical protein [Candidatus Eremiobacteraeota bacterium]
MPGDVARELLMLGLLRRAPLSAYEVDRAVRGHAPLYRGLKRGNVYHALARLAQARLLTVRTAKATRGPLATKTIYRLSVPGERHFRALLRTVLTDLQSTDTALEIAYVLLGQLPRDEALRLVCERRDVLAQHEGRLHRFFDDMVERGGSASIGAGHALHRARAEQRFLADTVKLLGNPRWEPAWVTDDGPISATARKL